MYMIKPINQRMCEVRSTWINDQTYKISECVSRLKVDIWSNLWISECV